MRSGYAGRTTWAENVWPADADGDGARSHGRSHYRRSFTLLHAADVEIHKLMTWTQHASCLALVASFGACGGEPKQPAKELESAKQKPATQTPAALPAVPEFSPLPCPSANDGTGSAADMQLRASDLKLSVEVDHLSIREVRHDGQRRTLGERGVACSAASVREDCVKALSALEAQVASPAKRACLAQDCMGTVYVVTTQGDRTAIYRSVGEVRSLLGAIDGAREAWLIAYVALGARPYVCGAAALSAFRPLAEGYELRERVYTRVCKPTEQTEFLYKVDATSESTVAKTIVASDPGCMIIPEANEQATRTPKRTKASSKRQ